jgi:hypothetical protein
MADAGHRRVGVIQAGTTGMFYLQHFEREARFAGVRIVGKEYANVNQAYVEGEFSRLRTLNPDPLLFLGMGESALPFCRTR